MFSEVGKKLFNLFSIDWTSDYRVTVCRQIVIDLWWLPWQIFSTPSCRSLRCVDRTMTAWCSLWLRWATSSLGDPSLWRLHTYQSSVQSCTEETIHERTVEHTKLSGNDGNQRSCIVVESWCCYWWWWWWWWWWYWFWCCWWLW